MNEFLLGMLVWQAICFILILADKKELTTGLPGFIFLFADWAYDKVRTFIKARRFKGWLIDQDGKPCYCESKYYDFFLDLDVYTAPGLEARKKYSKKDGWKDVSMDVVSARYTPLKVLKNMGAYPLGGIENYD